MRARGWEPGWSSATPVLNLDLQPGSYVNVVVDQKTAQAIKDGLPYTLGGWATFDDVDSVAVSMRQRMAISGGFKDPKDGPFYVVRVEIIKPVQANIGFVGPQTDRGGGLLRGGGSQVQLDDSTGATHVVAIRWTYEGQVYEVPPVLNVLPNLSGYVHCEGGGPLGKALIVMNSDNTQRLRIPVPCIDERSKPEKGYMVLPPSSASFGGIRWGVEGNDGHTDYLFKFDWSTGALLQWAKPDRNW